MYLSDIQLHCMNRETARLLGDPYKLHAALMSGFPVDGTDAAQERVLFRQEPPMPGSPWVQVIVQSQTKPDWGPLLERHPDAAHARRKAVELAFQPGQRLRFRLRANPTVTRNGNRLGLVGEPDQRAWLEKRATGFGFALEGYQLIDEGLVGGYKKGNDGEVGKGWHRMSFRAVCYQGVLRVADADLLRETVSKGIGPAKGFGCGLLSLARG